MKTRADFFGTGVIGLACCCGLLAGATAGAAEIEAEMSAGVGFSDNIARTEDDPIEETVGLVGINIGITEDTSRLDADVRVQADYLHYVDGTFDDELVGGLAGTLNFTLVPERLTWLVQENYGQQAVNPLTPSNPGNRENVSFFTTGPTLRLLPASRNYVQLDARYSSVNYEIRASDNERQSYGIEFGRQTSRDTTLSLVANTTEVDYENELATDFDRHEGFIRYQVTGSRNTLSVDLGVTEVEIDDETGDGTLMRLSWSRQISGDKTFTLTGGSNYSDQGDIFRLGQGMSTDIRETEDVVGSNEPFTNNFASMGFAIDRARTSVSFGLSWNQEDYEGDSPADRDIYGADLQLRRDISERTFGRLGFQYRERDFSNIDTADDNFSATAELGVRFGPATSLSLQYAHFARSGDRAAAEVEENRLFLRFTYIPGWGR